MFGILTLGLYWLVLGVQDAQDRPRSGLGRAWAVPSASSSGSCSIPSTLSSIPSRDRRGCTEQAGLETTTDAAGRASGSSRSASSSSRRSSGAWKVQRAMNRFLDNDADIAQPAPGIDRLKVPFLRQIDDSEAARERTLIARWGRFVTRNHKPVFVVVLLVADRARGRRRRSSGSAPPTRARSRPSRRRGAHTTCWRRASAPASTGRSRSSST